VANREEYRFDVNANTEQANQAIDSLINKFSKLERTINKINKKGFENNYTTNQKDMDKSMRSYATMAKQMRDAHKYIQGSINKSYREMEKIKPPKPPRKPNKPHEPAPIRKNARKDVRDDYEQKMEKFKKRQANYEKRSKNYDSQVDQYNKEKAAYDERVKAHENFVNRMITSEKKLQDMMKKSQKTHQNTQGYEQNYSKNFEHKLNKNGIYNMPANPEEATKRMKAIFGGTDPLETSNNDIKETIRNVQRLRRRNDSLSRRGSAAGHLSYQQSKNFHDDYMTSQTKYSEMRESNFRYAGKLGTQRSRLQDQIDEIEKNPEKYGDEGYQNKLGYQRNIEAIDEEIKNRHKLNAEIEKTMTEMQEYRDRLLQSNVSVDAPRGSFKRNLSERSAAIGLAMGATMAGSFVNLYSQGSSADKAMRDNLVYAGQSTGQKGTNWGKFESNTINAGLAGKLGVTGQEMMEYQNSYLQNAGYHGLKDLNSATTAQAKFSRATGIDSSTTSGFFGTMAQTGGMHGSQIKDFQDAFVGAIKESGMQGRQQQQLQALQSIVQNVGADKQLSNSQVNSIVGLQGLLASSGNRSLQGQSGADFMNQMNGGIQQGFFNPQMRLIFGGGTKYQGMGGMWQLEKQMNNGVIGKDGVKNLQSMTGYAMANGGSDKNAQNYIFSQLSHSMGMKLSTDQIEAFMNMARDGKLTDKNVKAFEDKSKKTGAKESAKNAKNYKDSDAATNNQSDAVYQKQAKALYDNTKIIREANNLMAHWNPFLYGGMLAVAAAVGGLAVTLGSFGISTGIKTFASGKFGFNSGNLAKYNTVKSYFGVGSKNRAPEDMPSTKGPTTPGSPPPGFHDKNAPARTEAWEQEKRRAAAAGEEPDINKMPHIPPNIQPNENPSAPKTGNWFSRSMDGIKGAGSSVGKFFTEHPIGKAMTKGLGGAFKLAGKLAMPLAIGTGIYDTVKAKKGHHVEAGTKAAGGIAGMWGGAEAGAAIGTAIAPGLGTAIGGILGGIGGGIAGSGLGGWIGKGTQKLWNGVTGIFKPTKAEAAMLPKGKSNKMTTQKDEHNTNTKARTEDKRMYNVQNESSNLGTQGKQLTQMQQLLAQARQQNGIIGSLSGLAGGGGGEGGDTTGGGGAAGGGGGAGLTNAKGNQASIWNYFAQQGYSNSAISGIIGNIGTETGGTFDPTTKQKGGGPGRGLAQWSVNGRYKQLQAYAKKHGLDPNSMQAQLGFMSQEMKQMGLTPDKMNKLSTSQATALFEKKYEAAGKPNMSSRNGYAQSAYNQFANSPQATSNAIAGTKSGATHTINSNIKVSLTANGGAADQIASNSALQAVGQKIQQMIYGSMGYYSTETTRA
jgi:hypothetical protein